MKIDRKCQFKPNAKTFWQVGFKLEDSTLHFPESWKIRTDEEGTWGDILDSQDRIRGFYRCTGDAINNITLVTRYTIESTLTIAGRFDSPIRIYVADQGTFSFNVGKCDFGKWETLDSLKLLAKKHLDGKHPGWEDPAMYW